MNALNTIRGALNRFFRDEDGASAVEYAILVALIGGAVALAVAEFNLVGIFTQVSDSVSTNVSGATAR
jgi:Flp pilus assembly pilin Flp